MSQSTVLTSYRDLVRKGQDQFSKELEQIVPGVKLGESMFSVFYVTYSSVNLVTVYFIINDKCAYTHVKVAH